MYITFMDFCCEAVVFFFGRIFKVSFVRISFSHFFGMQKRIPEIPGSDSNWQAPRVTGARLW